MTTPATAPSVGTTVEQLRSAADSDVTITTAEGRVTGSVLSCTRLSVWLISDDEDHVIPLDEILDILVHVRTAA